MGKSFFVSIFETIDSFHRKTGYVPNALYLGEIERENVKKAIKNMEGIDYEKNKLCGLTVVEVNRLSYLSVGISDLLIKGENNGI